MWLWFEYSCLVGFFFGGSDVINEVVFSSVAYLCYVKFVYALYLAEVRILINSAYRIFLFGCWENGVSVCWGSKW